MSVHKSEQINAKLRRTTFICDGPFCSNTFSVSMPPSRDPCADVSWVDTWFSLSGPPEDLGGDFCSAKCLKEWAEHAL